ncbi:cation diffusion facilitator family transporter [Segeticoccus rhizosphaerae]|uniref:cation diffusion facilitator family transporter n=1 Tax=Segeticoccus rhizosphaerae TaxID=1104777 RepID=UPI001EE3F8AD|nr:cation diffusion facilitator family transporter [Ornithinicoccus soli]
MSEPPDRNAAAHPRRGNGDQSAHAHAHRHGHDHPGGWRGALHGIRELFGGHSHESTDRIDSALEASQQGMRALWISLAVLGVTAVLQAVVVLASHSVALLGDTLHNAADALTALPLAVAFTLGRRVANSRYTYGYGRAEDLAGLLIVVIIAASAVLTAYEAIRRLADPRPVGLVWAVALAGVIGFVGNEWVARYRIRVGRRIGSAALVADGLHARTDGFTSLAVVVGAGGVALGWSWADPAVGLLITAAIAMVLKDAARQVYYRLMDAVDPNLLEDARRALEQVPGVLAVGRLRMRWVGHELHADVDLALSADLSLTRAHAASVRAEQQLCAAVPRLTGVVVHVDPAGHIGRHPHHDAPIG